MTRTQRNTPRKIDWLKVPAEMTSADVAKITGAADTRIDESCANGSLKYSCLSRGHGRTFSRADVRSWHEPDLSAPRLTVDAAAKLAGVAPRTITSAIVRGELAVEAATVAREDLERWRGGAR